MLFSSYTYTMNKKMELLGIKMKLLNDILEKALTLEEYQRKQLIMLLLASTLNEDFAKEVAEFIIK